MELNIEDTINNVKIELQNSFSTICNYSVKKYLNLLKQENENLKIK